MTITQFHHALLQGRGCCVLAAKEDPEKYREEVLWACGNLVSFDTQCEGSRSWFIHGLVSCYPDPDPFIRAAARALKDCPSDGGWRIFCLAELLERFMQDGSELAWKTLLLKYRQLYHSLLRIGPPETPYWPERDDFSKLAVICSWNRDTFLGVARDIGRLFLETDWFDGFDFDWLYCVKGERYQKALCREAEKDKYLAAFVRVCGDALAKLNQQRAQRRKRLPRRDADPEEVARAVERYLSAANPEDRADALEAFRFHPYPADPWPLILDTASECERLSRTAWIMLEKIRHQAVRSFALKRLGTDEEAFGLFVTNYQPGDGALLERYIRAIPVDFEETTGWHDAQFDVLRMHKAGNLPPRSLLTYIFDTNYCSICRARTLAQMGRRRMVTEELLTECLYDSNDEIRAYARRALNRQKRRN